MSFGLGDDGRRAVAEVMATPVGRRWVLRAGLAGAAAAVLAESAGGAAAAAPSAAGARTPRGVERVTLHFVLGAAASLPGLVVHANGAKVALTPHTAASRKKLRSQGIVFSKMNTQVLTHYAEVQVPDDRGLPVTVYGQRAGKRVILLQKFHAPARGVKTFALAAKRLQGSYRSVVGSPTRVRRLGLDPGALNSPNEVVDLEAVVDTESTAVTLAMMHPNVATIDPVAMPVTASVLSGTSSVETLGGYITSTLNNGGDWATEPTVLDGNGNPSTITVGGTTTTFTSFQLNTGDSTLVSLTKQAVTDSVKAVRDTGSVGTVVSKPLDALQDKSDTATWHVTTGVVPTSSPYQAPTGKAAADAAAVTATVYNTGLWYGTFTDVGGPVDGSQVPMTFYNNYVRWVWVYVQYLDAAGNNLSLNQSASFPDTPYAQSVGLLPQIFTVLGIPIWDTNTLTKTLNFPPKAVTARILYCGLGNSALDGGWRQYFPAAAYPDHVAPQQEVVIASCITGIFTIGLTAFALLADSDVAAALGVLYTAVKEARFLELEEVIDDLFTLGETLSGAEAVTTTLLTGAATGADVAADGGAQNLWSLLAALGTLIPKVLFAKNAANLVVQVTEAFAAQEASEKVLQTIPLVGQVIAVIEVAGDVATLAEAIGETAASPWVIQNSVSLSYPVSVVVSKDDRNATWPATARSYRLEATLDGATAVAPTTSAFNAGGDTSLPIVVNTSAPFGGDTITWSIVVLDADGHQVGTGSAQFTNNDAADLPSVVNFAITELPAWVDSSTVFTRTVTTGYDPAAGGYTWINPAPADTGTQATGAIQEVCGVTVATRLGVAGVVWKHDDKYWLRAVPTVENGGTVSFGTATRQGFTRRPHLIFDTFVGAQDAANHVLLDPDTTTGADGYHIRPLQVDPATGNLSWDPTTATGYFQLPVSDAAVHTSGHVASIDTASARLGHVQPAATPLPPQAAYTAGPGTQVGLMRSPTAVALTNPGTLVVLDAGAAQLAAYDLHGNPALAFGTPAKPTYTVPLLTGRTYLDVSVDGTGHIYVLSYAGSGTQLANFYTDVYTPAGVLLTAGSAGTNAPHQVVDYWRSIYTANFTPVLDTSTGQPHIDPALGVPEPSLSRLDPTG